MCYVVVHPNLMDFLHLFWPKKIISAGYQRSTLFALLKHYY